jgi:DNA-binding CsgD family transcriptional regulator
LRGPEWLDASELRSRGAALLAEFFTDGRGAELPEPLAAWLESGSKRPLVRRRGDRHVTVERAGDSLLLEEATDVASLTAREREILTWVARGKTNPEIASILWVAPSTIRKHLENVYAKLGVSSRTAAVTRFLGLVDAEDHAAESGPT